MSYKLFESHAHHIYEVPLQKAVEIFKTECEKIGAEKIAFLSIPHHAKEGGGWDFDALQNLKTLYLKHAFEGRGYAFAHLEHPFGVFDSDILADHFLKQAEVFARVGFDGVKMLEGYPSLRKEMRIPLCDRAYDKFYSFMEENAIPIVMHIANPENFWDASSVPQEAIALGRFCDDTYPTKNQLQEEVEAVLKKHPKLRFTLAHFGFLSYDIDRAKWWLDEYEYTAFDTTPGDEQYLEMLKNWDAWSRFFEAYQDRIIYGSDFYPFQNRRPQFVRQFFETEGDFTFLGKSFRGVAMNGDILQKIYFDNMQKRVGESKKIDLTYMRDKAEALRDEEQGKNACADEDIRLILGTV